MLERLARSVCCCALRGCFGRVVVWGIVTFSYKSIKKGFCAAWQVVFCLRIRLARAALLRVLQVQEAGSAEFFHLLEILCGSSFVIPSIVVACGCKNRDQERVKKLVLPNSALRIFNTLHC